jgi:hypothetical protein
METPVAGWDSTLGLPASGSVGRAYQSPSRIVGAPSFLRYRLHTPKRSSPLTRRAETAPCEDDLRGI